MKFGDRSVDLCIQPQWKGVTVEVRKSENYWGHSVPDRTLSTKRVQNSSKARKFPSTVPGRFLDVQKWTGNCPCPSPFHWTFFERPGMDQKWPTSKLSPHGRILNDLWEENAVIETRYRSLRTVYRPNFNYVKAIYVYNYVNNVL